MQEDFEAELRVALVEGILSLEAAEVLRGEALRLSRSPLELLRERGRITEDTFASFRAQVRPAPPVAADPDATSTMQGPPPVPLASGLDETAFPVPGWERYQHVRFLGKGGMGRVFLAHDPRLRRDVALKFVRGDDAELTRRSVSEARAQARVNHERVCKVYEAGEVAGKIYIAMQYIDGAPLSALARELTVEQKAMVLRDAAEGVHEAHRVGLIHRDLKPSNIMVERTEDGLLKPYVMDFGLARDWNADATAPGTVLGTPHYMAPEQARGEVSTLDRRADVYSLGATLYAVLTGQPPVSGTNGLEVLSRIATEEPRPPRALDPNVPADLEAIALKCLEKDRSARYDSARALAQDLERFLAGEPVQARSAGLWYRLGKSLRKHRLAVSIAAPALVLALLALGWGALARRDVAVRERLARQFTEAVEGMEAMARYSELAPLHDTRADRAALRERMARLEADIQRAGNRAVGPGHYALGRGYLTLGEDAKALEHLEAAWQAGFREPRVAYALAVVLGHLYQERLLEAERVEDPAQRKARKAEVQRRYRDPALAYLRQGQGVEGISTEYVAALLAFYEDRLEDALARLDAIGGSLPWFYEAPKLRGDILLARATRRWNDGERAQALADFEAGRQAYAAAAEVGRSVPAVYLALGELEYAALVMELYGHGDVAPRYEAGLDAVRRALAVLPEHASVRVLEARLHRRLLEHYQNQGKEVGDLAQKAIAAAEAALASEPTRLQARIELGRSLCQWAQYLQSKHQDAREQLRRSVEAFEGIAPDQRDHDTNVSLGLAWKTWGDFEEQVGGEPLPKWARSIEAYLTAIRIDDRDPDAWIDLGIAYLMRASYPRGPDPEEDLARAREALDKARATNPQHVVPYFYAGEVHTRLARRQRARGGDARPDLTRAIEMYEQGLELRPDLPPLHSGLALAHVDLARESWDRGGEPFEALARARATLEASIASAPKQSLGYVNLGEVRIQQARYERDLGRDPGPAVRAADAALQTATRLDPGNAGAWANLGTAHAVLAGFEVEHGRDPQRTLARAGEALHRALGINASSAQAWLYLGEVHATRARWLTAAGREAGEDFGKAANAFEQALGLSPERQEYRIAFGHFCRARAGWEKASRRTSRPWLERGLAAAEEVLAARPGWADALLLRGLMRMELAELEASALEKERGRSRASEDLARALSANPNLEHAWRETLALLKRRGPR